MYSGEPRNAYSNIQKMFRYGGMCAPFEKTIIIIKNGAAAVICVQVFYQNSKIAMKHGLKRNLRLSTLSQNPFKWTIICVSREKGILHQNISLTLWWAVESRRIHQEYFRKDVCKSHHVFATLEKSIICIKTSRDTHHVFKRTNPPLL